jgi:hypothetical protein
LLANVLSALRSQIATYGRSGGRPPLLAISGKVTLMVRSDARAGVVATAPAATASQDSFMSETPLKSM